MVAERLGLWRLTNFTLTRLPSPIDVHLFRAVGRNVPDDRRLVVLSDVRDLSVVRDAHGRVRALPQLEHVLDACLDALRAARAGRPRRRAVGLEPRAALRVAGGGPAARRVRQRRQPAGAAHRGAGAGADPRAVPAGAPAGRGGRDGADGAAPARVAAARGRADRADHEAAEGAAARARRLHAEGDPGPAPRRGLPLRAAADARAQPGPGRRAGHVHRVRPRRHRRAGAGAAPAGQQHRQHRAGHRQHPDGPLPRRHAARGADRRPDAGAGRDRRARVPPGARGARAGAGAVGAGRVVRGVRRREDRDGLRHREHGLDLARAARPDRVHPGGPARSTSS